MTTTDEADACYLIRKGGYWYRRNCSGYTDSAIIAGRYTIAEAERYSHPNGKDGPRDGMSVAHEDYVTGDEAYDAFRALTTERDRLLAERSDVAEAVADKMRLDYLRDESRDLRCFSVPTGGDDADIGWRVIDHWMADPQERTIAEVYHDDPRAAIDAAIREGNHEHD